MPATSALVSLDHAKDWAKRLVKHGQSVRTLAQAQEAVAVMLGHASWHALSRHYQQPPAPPVLATAALSQEEQRPFDEAMEVLCASVNRLYPGLNATGVVEMARDLDVFGGMVAQAAQDIGRLTYDGYATEDAVKEVLGEEVSEVSAPPGHVLLRMMLADETCALVVVTSEIFGQALHKPPAKNLR